MMTAKAKSTWSWLGSQCVVVSVKHALCDLDSLVSTYTTFADVDLGDMLGLA
jgi:hypothetical protein